MAADHKNQITRLNRISGQVKGIAKMIEEGRYCIDILNQTKAVTQALRQVELSILENHIQHCLKDAMQAQDQLATQEKLNEIMTLIKKQI